MWFLSFILLIALLFECEKLYSQTKYNVTYFLGDRNYEIETDAKPRRKNFKWFDKIGFDSIAVEAGLNRSFIIPHDVSETFNTGTTTDEEIIWQK